MHFVSISLFWFGNLIRDYSFLQDHPHDCIKVVEHNPAFELTWWCQEVWLNPSSSGICVFISYFPNLHPIIFLIFMVSRIVSYALCNIQAQSQCHWIIAKSSRPSKFFSLVGWVNSEWLLNSLKIWQNIQVMSCTLLCINSNHQKDSQAWMHTDCGWGEFLPGVTLKRTEKTIWDFTDAQHFITQSDKSPIKYDQTSTTFWMFINIDINLFTLIQVT